MEQFSRGAAKLPQQDPSDRGNPDFIPCCFREHLARAIPQAQSVSSPTHRFDAHPPPLEPNARDGLLELSFHSDARRVPIEGFSRHQRIRARPIDLVELALGRKDGIQQTGIRIDQGIDVKPGPRTTDDPQRYGSPLAPSRMDPRPSRSSHPMQRLPHLDRSSVFPSMHDHGIRNGIRRVGLSAGAQQVTAPFALHHPGEFPFLRLMQIAAGKDRGVLDQVSAFPERMVFDAGLDQ